MNSVETSNIDYYLKLFQMVFYAVGTAVAVLTYRSAKRGLLNTVNTEYQKHVLNNMVAVSSELYSEFDDDSDFHWTKIKSNEEFLVGINKEILPIKYEIITGKLDRESVGMPVTKDIRKLKQLEKKFKSDPFMPKRIRAKVLNYISNRIEKTFECHDEFARDYVSSLRNEKNWERFGKNLGGLSNDLNQLLYKYGVGISQNQEAVDDIRKEIHIYYAEFDPIPSR